MGTQKQVIQIDAQINTHLGNLNDTVAKLKKGISDGVTKMDLSKGTGKALSSYIRQFKDEYDEFQKYIKTDGAGKSFVDFDDSGKAVASGKRLLKVFEDIQEVMKGINSKDAAGFDKLFPQGKIGDADGLLKVLEKVEPKLKELQEKQALRITLTGDITSIESKLTQLKTELAEDNKLQIDVSSATTKLEEATKQVDELQKKLQTSLQGKIGEAQKELTTAQTERASKEQQIRSNRAVMDQTGVHFDKKGGIRYGDMSKAGWQNNTSRPKAERDAALNAIEQYETTAAATASLEAELAQIDAKIAATTKNLTNLNALAAKISSPEGMSSVEGGELTTAGVEVEQVEKVTKALEEQRQAQENLNKARAQETARAQKQGEVETLTADLETKKKQVEQLGEAIAKLSEKANLSELTEKLKDLGFDEVTEDSLKSEEGIKRIKEALNGMSGERLEKVKTELKNMGIIAEDTNGDIKLAAGALQKFDDNRGALTRTQQDMENLKNRMLDFFSLTNTVQLFKRAVTQAFNTVKELDAVMTETAVVTDFSVGDMWDKLPEYSTEANKLGASISSLYQATTLYYQQGLETEAAMSVGIETMKMARIAGMEATEATQAMTAALRGFNMEVNEMNATRVNDVYSELAAITAADTEQIATAMTKTASIAASANMEFETTAALLAQIIETTQEAPETAGTAMKTIIARFTEVKSLFSEGQLTGKDEEGESIDINKIDKALSSVGISLKDFLNGQKGIDDIFLELASKWDTLDLATQRYIATTAAGSRQQSRFIAMMSDYGRTMELVSAANNSAGASQRQFDKTQESLEAKLQKLKNAWDQFTMGIANSDLIKGGVDMLTKILNIVNTLIDKLSGGSGLIKGVLSLGAAFMGLSAGESALNGILKFVSNHTTLGSLPSFENFKKGDNTKTIFGSLKGFFTGIPGTFSKFKEDRNKIKLLKATNSEELKSAEANAGGLYKAYSKIGALLSNPYFWGAAAAVTAVAIIAKTIDRYVESEKEKRKRLENQVEVSKEAEKNARSTRDSLKADISSLRNLENGFDKLARGTSEWKEQLIQANQQAIELLEKYEGLQLETGAYGQLTISEESYQKVQEQLLERAYKAQAQQASASLELAILDYKEEWRLARQSADKYQTSQTYLEQSSTGVVTSTAPGATLSGNGELQQNVTIENETDAIFSLSDKQARTYLSALAEAGINSTNLDTRGDQIRTILESQGYSGDIDSLISSMSALGEDFDKLSASALAASTRIEGLEYSFFFNAAQNRKNKDFADDVAANYLDFIYSSSGGLSKHKQQVEADYKGQSKNELLKEYADKMGYYYSGGMVYYSKDQMNAPIQFGEDNEQIENTLRSTLADLKISEEATSKLDELSLTNSQLEAHQTIFGSQAPSLVEWVKLDSIEEAYQALGLRKEAVFVDDETLTALGGELQKIVNNNNEQVQKKYADVFKQVGRVYTTNGIATDTSKKVGDLIEQFGEDFAGRTSNAIQALSPLDSNISDTILSNLLLLKDAEEFKAASDLISNIDWSNPIKAAEQIKQAMITGDKATKEFAETLNETAKSFLGAGSQVRYFIESTDFSAVYGEIQKIIDKSGELTAADILEIADDYDSLGKILENTDISAAGLAKTLELIGDGTLQIYQLTDAVMAAASGFSSLESVVAETLQTIKDFDPGINETDAIDFLEKYYKVLSENIEKGYYGNSQNIEFLDFILGPNWRKGKTGKEIEQEIVRLTGLFEGEDGGLQKMVQNMFSGKKYSGEGYEQGKPVFDPSKLAEMDSLGAQAYIAETQNVSDVMAGIILTYLKNLYVGFGQGMEKQDRNLAAEKFWNEQKEQAGEGPITIDQSEIDAFAEIQKLSEEEKDFFTKVLKDQGATITQYRVNGKLRDTKEIIDELDTVYNYNGWGRTEGYYKDNRFINGKYNEQEIKQTLSRENFSEEEQEQIFKDMIANATENGGTIEVETTLSNGDLKTIEVTSLEDYENQVKQLETALEQNLITEAIAKGFVEGFTNLPTETLDIKIRIQDKEFVITADPSQAEQILEDFYYEQDGKTITVNISSAISQRKLDFLEKFLPGITGEAQKAGLDITNYADGIVKSPTTHDALVSEIGPELIYRADGTAYLSGLNGPEITKIHRGDTVYTAEETKQIFRNRGKTIPNFMAGKSGETNGGSSESGSSSGTNWFGSSDSPSDSDSSLIDELIKAIQKGSKDSGEQTQSLIDKIVEEKTSLDKLYNLVSQIEETTRQRERLERRYEALIKDTDSSIKDVVDNSKAQLAVLEAEKELQESLIKGRQAQIEAYTAQNAGYAQYAGIETNAYGDQVMRIDWDAINAISNDDERKKVEEYVSKLEGWLDELTEAEDALWDIEDAVEEINERGKEEYLDLENQIKEALISERQEEIDKLSAIDESINNANSSMMQAIQDTLSQQRQERDNAKTEEELAEKERRLQYLKQDTSGANALEIMELEKELAEGREDYTDTLIDQKIEELQKQNDQAAEQRQKQIDILSKQLEMYERSEQIWKDVHNLINNGIDNDGIVIGSSLHNILKDYLATQGLSSIAKKDWWSDLDKTIKNAMAWLQTGRQLENLPDSLAGKTINFTVGDETLTGKVDENGNVTTEDGAVYKDVYEGAGGIYRTEEGKQSPPSTEQEPVKPTEPELPEWYSSLEKTQGFGYGAAKEDIAPVLQALDYLGYNGSGGYYFDPTNPKMGDAALLAMSAFQKANGLNASGVMWNTDKYGGSKELKDQGKKTFEALKKATKNKLGLTQFKTGGVADFTGPAWLDGTKSRPEIILNQQDSRNFIQLKDILGSILKGNHYSSSSTENNGDTVYDIDINVEKLEREVDLDTISNYVERKITETARYRNNNAVKISR